MNTDEVWAEVQKAQKRGSGGFLRREDVEQAVELFREYTDRHPSFEVTCQPLRDSRSGTRTVLRLSRDGTEATRWSRNSGSGITISFDFYADDNRELWEELKEEGFSPHSKEKRMPMKVGTNEPPEGTVVAQETDISAEPTEETLESLFKINKHARKYAGKAENHYHRSNHYSARRNSSKKEALYDLKGKVLSEIAENADEVELHRIDGKTYFCLYFEEWSFHTHLDELDKQPGDVEGETEKLDDFSKDSDVGGLSRSLKASLIHLHDQFGFNANELLPEKHVGDYFIGWKYLG